eukprot:RCo028387
MNESQSDRTPVVAPTACCSLQEKAPEGARRRGRTSLHLHLHLTQPGVLHYNLGGLSEGRRLHCGPRDHDLAGLQLRSVLVQVVCEPGQALQRVSQNVRPGALIGLHPVQLHHNLDFVQSLNLICRKGGPSQNGDVDPVIRNLLVYSGLGTDTSADRLNGQEPRAHRCGHLVLGVWGGARGQVGLHLKPELPLEHRQGFAGHGVTPRVHGDPEQRGAPRLLQPRRLVSRLRGHAVLPPHQPAEGTCTLHHGRLDAIGLAQILHSGILWGGELDPIQTGLGQDLRSGLHRNVSAGQGTKETALGRKAAKEDSTGNWSQTKKRRKNDY